VSLAGAAGAAWYALGLLSRRRQADGGLRAAGCAAAAGLAAYALLLLPYYAGSASYQAASRLFVPAALSLSLLAAALLGELSLARPGLRGLLAAAAAGTFLLYLPVAAENKFMDLLILTRQHRIETKFLRDEGDKNVLVVSDRPRLFTALEYGAVNFEYARGGSAELLEELDRKLFSRILVMQEISYETGKATPATDPGPDYSLEPLLERQNSAESYVRISAASRAAAGARRIR